MNPSPRRISLAIAAAAIASLGGASAAHAVTIGSDLNTSPTIGLGNDTTGAQTVKPAGTPNPIASPINGVLVRIVLRYGQTDANPGTVGFRILNGTNPFTARPATLDGGELRFPLLANLALGRDDYVDYQPVDANGRPIGIPIVAGERLGVAQQKTGSAFIAAAVADGTVSYVSGQHLSGSLAYTDATGYEFTMQGIVEPDADGDRRGDFTQDACPAVANDPTTGLCPPQVVTREVTRTVTVEVQKCHVPLLRGLTRGLANRLLSAAGCRLGTVGRRTVRRGRPGRVIAQSTRAGTVVDFGTAVGITLSRRAGRRSRR
jgi:hypothetical protein